MAESQRSGNQKPPPSLRAKLSAFRTANTRDDWTHAASYRGLSPAAMVHRARLDRVRSLVEALGLPGTGTLVDLGCSDGFIASELRASGALPEGWRVVGYDHTEKLLAAAEARGLSNAAFHWIDLNDQSSELAERGDLVVSLETLEHVGDWRSALHIADDATVPGGRLILSLPNEVGAIGLAKLTVRPLLRRRPYGDLFPSAGDRVRYAARVAAYRDISYLREPARPGWGPHLGFDYRNVLAHIHREFVEPGRWTIVSKASSFMGANRFLTVRKASD
jgi:SAM-dependent methyltransferase